MYAVVTGAGVAREWYAVVTEGVVTEGGAV
jgi:hypothetical protein